MKTYNKLIRNNIPAIIESTGKSSTTRILDEAEYVTELRTKLNEESEEYFAASSDADALEELADMLEVIRALAATHGADPEQLEQIRADKAAKRGGFDQRIYLIDVHES
ncbi:nucleoside triphosphate pyrophosphohydrolase [Saccharibacillus sp. JS10]|uniref:nucleoside triphosphate pyrophosphohydrolase n=1 Tax=Saccharibacillus sp. JS10 TaxID=2950552 RepID=UPI00210ECAA7|nr:nucleoside triphosphate pyrophosphohydrolase [Saccharibacillus sp. JS10]MCQ4086568.1 nucleoside triphosphate pyrophosphohydrolase [Saccharibacillus sp. JS10]